MTHILRRKFTTGLASSTGLAALGSLSGCSRQAEYDSRGSNSLRIHPLEGIAREKLKITGVKVTPLSYVDPKGNIWRSKREMVWKTDACVLQVFTDQGIEGVGEPSPYCLSTWDSGWGKSDGATLIKKYVAEVIEPGLLGQNPFDVDQLCSGGENWGERCAWAGVDAALWDIIGKAKGLPVYKLLATDGEPDTHLHMYASGGDEHEWYNNGDEALIEEALRYKEMGFDAMKFRMGTDWEFSGMTLDKYIPIMQRLREAVGPDFKLCHENMDSSAITIEDLVQTFCPAIEELKFHWFEHPMRGIENYLKVKDALDVVKVSGGEAALTRFEVREWLNRKAYDIVQSDTNVTGITECWHIARMAHLMGVPHCPHSWHGSITLLMNAHLVAAIPNRHMLERNMTFNPFHTDLVKDMPLIVDGFMDLPDKPGLGIELTDDLEKRFPYAPGHYGKPNPVFTR